MAEEKEFDFLEGGNCWYTLVRYIRNAENKGFAVPPEWEWISPGLPGVVDARERIYSNFCLAFHRKRKRRLEKNGIFNPKFLAKPKTKQEFVHANRAVANPMKINRSKEARVGEIGPLIPWMNRCWLRQFGRFRKAPIGRIDCGRCRKRYRAAVD